MRRGMDTIYSYPGNTWISGGYTAQHITHGIYSGIYSSEYVEIDSTLIEKSINGLVLTYASQTAPNGTGGYSPYFSFPDTIPAGTITNSIFQVNVNTIENGGGKYLFSNNSILMPSYGNDIFNYPYVENEAINTYNTAALVNTGRLIATNNTFKLDPPSINGAPSGEYGIFNESDYGVLTLKNNVINGFNQGVYLGISTNPYIGAPGGGSQVFQRYMIHWQEIVLPGMQQVHIIP